MGYLYEKGNQAFCSGYSAGSSTTTEQIQHTLVNNTASTRSSTPPQERVDFLERGEREKSQYMNVFEKAFEYSRLVVPLIYVEINSISSMILYYCWLLSINPWPFPSTTPSTKTTLPTTTRRFCFPQTLLPAVL